MACCQQPCVLQWGSRSTHCLPERTAHDWTYTYDGEVLIIGAGASGLAAARVLEQNQIRYSILEATNQLGGRVTADTGLADFPIDLGAVWIHNLPGVLDVVSGTPGLAAQTPLIPWLLEKPCNWDGRQVAAQRSKLFNDAFAWFLPESKWKRSTWYDWVRQNFAEKVQHRIRYDTAVTQVDYSGERVQVTTAGGQRIVADRVIMTASIGVLKSGDIKFVPDLSQRRMDAIAAVEFLHGFKLFLKFSEKFYPDVVECHGLSTWEKSYHAAAFNQGSAEHVLCLLAQGGATESFYAFESEDKWVAAALEELDRMFDGAATRTFTGDFRLEDWGRKKSTQGTWVMLPNIAQSDLAELNAPLDNKVYFAGELHEESRQLGVAGALLSGLATADWLLRQPGR